MRRPSLNTQGFGLVVAVLLVAVVAAVGIVGYRLVQTSTVDQPGSGDISSTSVTVPKTIKNQADVVTAGKALNSLTIDSSVNPDQLDSDLNSLL